MKVRYLATGAAAVALALAGPAGAVESPPTGIHPSVFATHYSGCLGGLRSDLARQRLFDRDFNPGRHQGTVGEEEFLRGAFGISDLAAFCAEFE